MKRLVITVIIAVLSTAAVYADGKPKRYEIKSGILTQVTQTNGATVKIQKYFDDYGNTTAEYQSIESYINGELQDMLIAGKFFVNGQQYGVNYLAKEKRVALKESEIINFLNMSSDLIDKYSIKKKGNGVVCGKQCEIYSIRTKDASGIPSVTKVWIWKGIPLKKEVSYLNIFQVVETTDIQENVPVDPSVFIVPDFEEVQK